MPKKWLPNQLPKLLLSLEQVVPQVIIRFHDRCGT
jgi:hypothetical protein